MYNKKVFRNVFCVFFCICIPAAAESFRVSKAESVTVSIESPEAKADLGINDALVMFMPKDLTFIQGIEIEIKIPQIVAEWRDSMAWTLFDKIRPAPDSSRIDYSGDRLMLGTLPQRLSWTVDIPFTSINSLKETPYASKLNIIPDVSSGYLFLRLQQAMKGVPDEFGDAKFDISVKLLLIDEGKLFVKLSGPAKPLKPYSVFVDDKPVTLLAGGNMFSPGVHTVSVISDYYRNEIRTVRIEQAKTCVLPITLRDIEPTLQITAPENARVFFDNAEIKSRDNPFVVTEGEHTVRFVIGDYEVIKTVNAVKGRSYTAALTIDAAISEEE